MLSTFYIMVALAVTPCSGTGMCAGGTVVGTYQTKQACLNALQDKTYQCLPVTSEVNSDTKQDREMRDLFFKTFEQFMKIAKENDQ